MGNLYQVISNPVGTPAPFPSESDLETFLCEHPAMLAEHLASGDNDGEIERIWRQADLPKARKGGGRGRLDMLFLHKDGGRYSLYIAELKNNPAGPGEVKQLVRYLENWREESNGPVRTRVAEWLEAQSPLSGKQAEGIAEGPLGVLVAPGFTADAVGYLVDWARANPRTPIQALKILRFRALHQPAHTVFVDDFYVVHRKGTRRSVRWTELADRLPDLVTESAEFRLDCGGRVFRAHPVFGSGRGKDFRLGKRHRAEALAAEERVLVGRESIQRKVQSIVQAIRENGPIPMSNLTLFLQAAFGYSEGEPDWQTPASHWYITRDGQRQTITQLDRLVK